MDWWVAWQTGDKEGMGDNVCTLRPQDIKRYAPFMFEEPDPALAKVQYLTKKLTEHEKYFKKLEPMEAKRQTIRNEMLLNHESANVRMFGMPDVYERERRYRAITGQPEPEPILSSTAGNAAVPAQMPLWLTRKQTCFFSRNIKSVAKSNVDIIVTLCVFYIIRSSQHTVPCFVFKSVAL